MTLYNGFNQTNNTKVVSISLCYFVLVSIIKFPWFSGMCFYIIVPGCDSQQHQIMQRKKYTKNFYITRCTIHLHRSVNINAYLVV